MALISLFNEKANCKSYQLNIFNLSGLLDEEFSDVTVTVSFEEFEPQIYKLHRNVLSGRSSVLHESLRLNRTLDITFLSPAQFELLVVFMYTGEMRFESVSELCFGLLAANLYKMDDLVDKCCEGLQEKLKEDPVNSLLILLCDEQYNFLYNKESFFGMLNETIMRNYGKIINSNLIEKVKKETLNELLKMDPISETPEIEIFEALSRWAKANCTQSEDPKFFKDVVGDLIYRIRYNLIPLESFTKNVAKSGLLPPEFCMLVVQRSFDEGLAVPFCTTVRQCIKKTDTSVDSVEQEEWKFMSTYSRKGHLVSEVHKWTSTVILSNENWDADSGWFTFPDATSTNTEWELQFLKRNGVNVRCQMLDKQFRAASVRVFAVWENNSSNWTEAAAVLKCGEIISSYFTKINDFDSIYKRVKVQVQWTELDQLPPPITLWKNDEAFIKCQWQISDWKTCISNEKYFILYSELFGPSYLQWRIVVMLRRILSEDRKNYLVEQKFVVKLQFTHVSELHIKCQMSLWDENFDQKAEKLTIPLQFEWKFTEELNSTRQNPLDLKVFIRIGRIKY